MSLAITSVSVWLVNLCPRDWSSRRSSLALLRVPLWTRAIFPELSRWGCAFSSVFPPWVAQRVWAIPMWWPLLEIECSLTSSKPSAFSPTDAYLVILYKIRDRVICTTRLWVRKCHVLYHRNKRMKTLTRPSDGLPDMVAIPALSYPRFFKMVKPSKRNSLVSAMFM